MGKITINEKYCKGCNICIEYCPMKIFEQGEEPNQRGYFVPEIVHQKRCTKLMVSKHLKRNVCGLCQEMCPDFAIEIDIYAEEDNNTCQSLTAKARGLIP